MSELRKGKKVATYPTVRGEIHTYSHPNDKRHFECNNPFHNQLPNRLIVVLLQQAAFNGSTVHSPFAFGKFNLATIKQLVRGEEYPIYSLSHEHDGDSKDQRGYYRFLQASGALCRGKGNMVGKVDWGPEDAACMYLTTRPTDVWTVQC